MKTMRTFKRFLCAGMLAGIMVVGTELVCPAPAHAQGGEECTLTCWHIFGNWYICHFECEGG